MNFSMLYSAITRGKWFISFKDVEAHQLLIDDFLNKGISSEHNSILSEEKPIPIQLVSDAGMSSSNNYADAPKGSTAIIPLKGSMLKYGTMCSYGTTEIAQLINEAAESNKITGIVLDVDSGGGSVDAIAPMVQAIQYAQSKQKPVIACCDLCASAAYYVSCYCDEIIAGNSISAEFGSIGVMMSFADYAKYYEKEGIAQHVIYSNLSTHKNEPFELAKKGDYEKIKSEELDPLARRFQETVKLNRGGKINTEVEGIIAGRMFFADDAKKNGLIDSIGTMDIAVKRAKEIRRDAGIFEYIKSKN